VCTVSRYGLGDEDSSGTQERECPPLEAGTRGLALDSRPSGLSACVVNCKTV
jgi:hypothetical protein